MLGSKELQQELVLRGASLLWAQQEPRTLGLASGFFLPIYLLSFLGQLSSFIILTLPIYLICPLFFPLSSLWSPVHC